MQSLEFLSSTVLLLLILSRSSVSDTRLQKTSLFFFFWTQSTRWYKNALIISFYRKSKLAQAYRITFFWLVRILFCFVNFVLTTLALIPFSSVFVSLRVCITIKIQSVYFLFVCDLWYSQL